MPRNIDTGEKIVNAEDVKISRHGEGLPIGRCGVCGAEAIGRQGHPALLRCGHEVDESDESEINTSTTDAVWDDAWARGYTVGRRTEAEVTRQRIAAAIEALPTHTLVDDDRCSGGKRPWPIAIDRYRSDVLKLVRGSEPLPAAPPVLGTADPQTGSEHGRALGAEGATDAA